MDPYIDYSEESTDDEYSTWTQAAFKKYFIETYHKIHNVGGAVPWTIKEQVQLSRMCGEYKPNDLADMMLWWHLNTPNHGRASSFTNFYSTRVHIYHEMKKASEDYVWE